MFIFWSLCSHVCYPYSLHHFVALFFLLISSAIMLFICRYRRRFPYLTCLHALYHELLYLLHFSVIRLACSYC